MKLLFLVFLVFSFVSGVEAPFHAAEEMMVVVKEMEKMAEEMSKMRDVMSKIESNTRLARQTWVLATLLLWPLWVLFWMRLSARFVVFWDKTIRDALTDPDRQGGFLRAVLLVDQNLLRQLKKEDEALAAAKADAAAAEDTAERPREQLAAAEDRVTALERMMADAWRTAAECKRTAGESARMIAELRHGLEEETQA